MWSKSAHRSLGKDLMHRSLDLHRKPGLPLRITETSPCDPEGTAPQAQRNCVRLGVVGISARPRLRQPGACCQSTLLLPDLTSTEGFDFLSCNREASCWSLTPALCGLSTSSSAAFSCSHVDPDGFQWMWSGRLDAVTSGLRGARSQLYNTSITWTRL